ERLKVKTELAAKAEELYGDKLKKHPDLQEKVNRSIEEFADRAGKAANAKDRLAWDKEIVNLQRNIVAQQANAVALDKGVAAVEEYRIRLQLLEFAKARHIDIDAKMARQMEDLAKKAGAVTLAAEKMKIALEIRREREGLFFTDEDVKIADKL